MDLTTADIESLNNLVEAARELDSAVAHKHQVDKTDSIYPQRHRKADEMVSKAQYAVCYAYVSLAPRWRELTKKGDGE